VTPRLNHKTSRAFSSQASRGRPGYIVKIPDRLELPPNLTVAPLVELYSIQAMIRVIAAEVFADRYVRMISPLELRQVSG
jgi:hypothetical protein